MACGPPQGTAPWGIAAPCGGISCGRGASRYSGPPAGGPGCRTGAPAGPRSARERTGLAEASGIGGPRCSGRRGPAAGAGAGGGRRGAGQADAGQVDRAAVPAGHLVRAGFVHGLDDRLGRGRGHLVAPGALRSGQQQVLVLGGCLGQVGVRAGNGDARLLHQACVLRQPFARDLAGVGHAYPSPIG
ncbi:hypothetical protein GCM10020295_68210 [Streptomyces cinereospinus]